MWCLMLNFSLSLIPDSLYHSGNTYHHFASSYPAVQSISQAKVHTKSQKAEIQTREHLLLRNHKAPCTACLLWLESLENPAGCGHWRNEGRECVGSKTQESRLWECSSEFLSSIWRNKKMIGQKCKFLFSQM